MESYEKITFMNFKRLMNEKDGFDTGAKSYLSTWRRSKVVQVLQPLVKPKSNFETQLEVFQSSMKYCLTIGQCLGLCPIMEVTEKTTHKIRYSILSWRYLFCFIILLINTMAFFLSFYRFTIVTISVTTFENVFFFMSNCIKNILFLRLTTKWHYIMQLVATSELNEYLDPYVNFKCNFATIVILSLAFINHVLSTLWKFIKLYDCGSDDTNVYRQIIMASYIWIFDVKVPYSVGIGIFIQIFTLIFIIMWNYAQVFIICVSLYLTSILNLLNKKIVSYDGQHLPTSYWRSLREDYNRATRLVHYFDDAINSIVFISIGSNFSYSCIQLYYLLGQRYMIGHTVGYCPSNPNGLLHGYENAIYFTFSTIFVLTRFLAVLLIAAKINSASVVAAPSLYSVPSSSYNTEVQRFLEQIHGDKVALTGLNFFRVTKEFILSVVGTIVTYELVLLQFNTEN